MEVIDKRCFASKNTELIFKGSFLTGFLRHQKQTISDEYLRFIVVSTSDDFVVGAALSVIDIALNSVKRRLVNNS